MSEAPSWLDTPAAAPAAAAAPKMDPLSIETKTATSATSAVVTDEKDLPSVILMMRLLNLGAAAALIAVSILHILSLPALSGTVLAVYTICGGILICCLETQLKFLRVMIAVNFGFLFNSMWRFLFYLILGSVCWAFGGIMGVTMACVMGTVAFFNTYVLCRYPAYRKIREQIAEEEDKRIEARISKEVKTQAIKQMTQSATGK
uniref:Golgi apparatus membrane protein TVP15 n=1 Tax=Pseudo-nitzschia australis TaxID=44445 RepID=A0A7S4ADI7_9STRA|eukprot:CAMPEP_0168187232 /NCGR_PEP_ID=MMETSP0139_2-20121125/14914_1 /TAXON_ID=44445 /ORGANISM="Pseudo-nitzschia australis, Strain 10249 10 AB" /LENGTH=203 /DNA_ID=CAMNT_0008109409 /DNA_START=142 /DNA_END=753 /DNA_ORIENTATION=-